MEVSNADRVVFPEDGITKGDVVDYYRKVGDEILPFLRGRALTVERYPRGIGLKGFMQKNTPDHAPEDLVKRHEVDKEDGGTTQYPVIHSVDGILFFANLGVITFHIPPTKVDDPELLDWVVWDLDPPQGGTNAVRKAANALRRILEERGIETQLMTSGSKGYHLRGRLDPPMQFEQVAFAARGMAAIAVAEHPESMTLAFRKAERGDRVFVDWLRNAPLSTAVSPWSLRGRPGAPVAAPIRWDELESVAPDGIQLQGIEERLGLDPWSEATAIDLAAVVPGVEAELERRQIVLEPFDRFRS